MLKPEKALPFSEEDNALLLSKKPYGGLNSRATTAQSNVSRKKYRVTTVNRDRKSLINEQNTNELMKSHEKNEKNCSFKKEPSFFKPKPYKSEIQLNKLTMGFLNYDKLKTFYKENQDSPLEFEAISPKIKPKFNVDLDKDLNIFEFFNTQNKNTGFKLRINVDGGLKRQTVILSNLPSFQNMDVFL